MALTTTQLQTLKAAIVADSALNAIPNTPDGNWEVAARLNQPDATFVVWRSSTPLDDITDAIVWANMTPAASPDGTQAWANKALHAQGKQFNLQNLIVGRTAIASGKANIRSAFQDALTNLPTKSDGTTQAAGWATVRTVMQRKATKAEKLFATGTGTDVSPGDLTWEGSLAYTDVEQARAL